MSQSRHGWAGDAGRRPGASPRAGDAERDATLARLTEASSRGQLDPVELDERLGAALRATYVAELEALTADLRPAPAESGSGRSHPTPRRRRPFWRRAGFQYHAVPYVLVNGMLVGIWAITGHGFFWPFFPIAGWGIGLGMHAVVAGSLPQGKRHHDAKSPAGVPLPLPPRPLAAPEAASTAHVAVIFADIVDSTGLNERLGDTTWNALRTRYLQIMRDCVASHHGVEVSSQGDGIFARFDLPAGAVAAAVAMQKRADAEHASSPRSPQLRVGIHAGQVIEDGDDLIGNMVNLAARLTADAEPGQILVTESVADLAGEAFSFEDCGLRQLRGISRPRHVLAVRR